MITIRYPAGEQIEITDHDDKAVIDLIQAFMRERSSMLRVCTAVKRTNTYLEAIVQGREGELLPWHRLHPVRRLQVEAVRKQLSTNKAHNILQAAIQVFTLVQNGYKSATALAKYCYAIDIFKYTDILPTK